MTLAQKPRELRTLLIGLLERSVKKALPLTLTRDLKETLTIKKIFTGAGSLKQPAPAQKTALNRSAAKSVKSYLDIPGYRPSMAEAFSSINLFCSSLYSISFCRKSLSKHASISTANRPAFFAPLDPNPIHATGIPPGI